MTLPLNEDVTLDSINCVLLCIEFILQHSAESQEPFTCLYTGGPQCGFRTEGSWRPPRGVHEIKAIFSNTKIHFLFLLFTLIQWCLPRLPEVTSDRSANGMRVSLLLCF